MIELNEGTKKYLANLVAERESALDAGYAQKSEAIAMRYKIQNLLKQHNIEFCAHNLALLGSERYKKYRISGRDAFMGTGEFKELVKQGAI